MKAIQVVLSQDGVDLVEVEADLVQVALAAQAPVDLVVQVQAVEVEAVAAALARVVRVALAVLLVVEAVLAAQVLVALAAPVQAALAAQARVVLAGLEAHRADLQGQSLETLHECQPLKLLNRCHGD